MVARGSSCPYSLSLSSTMGCESSQPMVANAEKNEVDKELERLHQEERKHYKVCHVLRTYRRWLHPARDAWPAGKGRLNPVGGHRSSLKEGLAAPPASRHPGRMSLLRGCWIFASYDGTLVCWLPTADDQLHIQTLRASLGVSCWRSACC